MDSKTKKESGRSPGLLELPREIRDLIYKHALVRSTIPIGCAVVDGPSYRKHTGFQCSYSPQLLKAYPLTSPRRYRSTWNLPIYDLKVDIQGGTWMDPKRAQMTYQLVLPCARPNGTLAHDKIAIQLLLVCRKMNTEARPLFYKKNIFSFTGKFPVSTALAFLQDRPVAALALISSIELVLTEGNNMRGTAEAHFPLTRRSSDCLVLQHAFHHFTDLCALLSSTAVHLRKLYLTVESLSSYGDGQPKSLTESLAWEIEKSDGERPWTASWIHPLLQIRSLESVKVYWISDRPRVRRILDTLAVLRGSLLECTETRPNDSPHVLELGFGILRGSDDNVTTTIVFDPHVEHLEWGDCSCENRSTGLEHIEGVKSGDTKMYYRCGVATWKAHEVSYNGFKSAYTSYCELEKKDVKRSLRRKSLTCAVHFEG